MIKRMVMVEMEEEMYGHFIEIDDTYTYLYTNSPEISRRKKHVEEDQSVVCCEFDTNLSMFGMDDVFTYASIIKKTICQLEYITGDKYSK